MEESDSAIEALRNAVLSAQSQMQQQLLDRQKGRPISEQHATRELAASVEPRATLSAGSSPQITRTGSEAAAREAADREHQELRRHATFKAESRQPWTATSAAPQTRSLTRRLSSAVGLGGLLAESTQTPAAAAEPPKTAVQAPAKELRLPLAASTAHRAALASLIIMPTADQLDAQMPDKQPHPQLHQSAPAVDLDNPTSPLGLLPPASAPVDAPKAPATQRAASAPALAADDTHVDALGAGGHVEQTDVVCTCVICNMRNASRWAT